MEKTLHITRTVGEDRIKKAKENNEEIAVLSTFLPASLADAATQAKTAAFVCALGSKCVLGDPKKTTPGASLITFAEYSKSLPQLLALQIGIQACQTMLITNSILQCGP